MISFLLEGKLPEDLLQDTAATAQMAIARMYLNTDFIVEWIN